MNNRYGAFLTKIVSLLSAALLVFGQISLLFLPARDRYPAAPESIRVMSFNVLWGGFGERSIAQRAKAVSRTITDYYPDSVGLQEATPEWMLTLKFLLPDYGYVGVGRDDGRAGGEFSSVFYRKDKYRVVESGTFWLSETSEVPSRGWDADCNRVCTWVVLENKQTGERYAHINTHLDHLGSQARANSVPMILEKAAEFADMPIICTGDFNFRENSGLYPVITADILKDAKFLSDDTMNHPTFHGYQSEPDPTRIIDFIFINEAITPLVYRVITEGIDGRLPSDHYPLYADVVLTPRG